MEKYLPILRNSPFFKGLTDNEILSILYCVNATAVSKERDSYIFRAGDSTEVMGLVVSGCVLVMQEDLWGHRNILSKCHASDFFGEPYAASPGAVLNISVVADEDCEIIFLNIQRLLVTCPTACEHHQKLIRNLVRVLANKILILNDKITHVGKRTTRDKLLSYLSAESIKHSSLSFEIPFDRQQLADYLCIDRAAMSTEISKLQKEGFAFFYKKGIKVDGLNDGIDNLPPVPQKSNRISKVDAIVGIVFSVIFTLVFLVCPQILCIAFVKNGVVVYEPLFNLEYIRQTWYFILVFGILGVTRDSVRLIDGSYTKRVMLVTIITNIIDGALTSIWLLNDRIMNSEFFDGIEQLFGTDAEVISHVFIHFNKVFLSIIILALTINGIETVVKAVKYSRQ